MLLGYVLLGDVLLGDVPLARLYVGVCIWCCVYGCVYGCVVRDEKNIFVCTINVCCVRFLIQVNNLN